MFLPPLPGMPMGGLPGLSLSTGPAVSGATGGTQSTPIFSPFTFDSSNMQVQIHSSGSQSATSAAGGQGAPGMPGAARSKGGLNLPMIAMLAGAWFLLR